MSAAIITTPGDQMPPAFVYDVETYPNFFCVTFKPAAISKSCGFKDDAETFEISAYCNQSAHIQAYVQRIAYEGGRMVGFNNLAYDYPVLHQILVHNTACNNLMLYRKSQDIIGRDFGSSFEKIDYHVPQVDLFKIHHFDNQAKRTSLKSLEFAMKLKSIKDLPFDPTQPLDFDQMTTLKEYNRHDVKATEAFYTASLDHIKFRDELSAKYGQDFTNANDTKIGKDFFIMQLEKKNPGTCHVWINNRKTPRQTPRPEIKLVDAVFPYVEFDRPEFQAVLDWFKSQTITETKGSIKDLSATVDGFQFVFGTGGIHGSIPAGKIESDNEYIIVDLDVASYYPNLGIKNRVYPEHLGEAFCDIYSDLYEQRKKTKKNSAENKMLKLALNGVYGDSNNQYSPFYDPLYTMKITINGQLLLCMLAEQLMKLDGLQMIQANTDGVTVRCPRSMFWYFWQIKNWWENITELELEVATYSRMWIRDVNNYVAEKDDGSLKRKGAYEYQMQWHQDHSMLVVPKIAQEVMVKGADAGALLRSWPTDTDFFLRAKVGRADQLLADGKPIQRISRYYVAKEGVSLVKVAPPAGEGFKRKSKISDALWESVRAEVGDQWDGRIHTGNRSVYAERKTGICAGSKVVVCNDNLTIDRGNLDYDFYLEEIKKLLI